MITLQCFRVRVVLQATKPVRLYAHPGPAVYALLAAAYGRGRNAEPVIPDGLLLDAPEQCRVQLAAGEQYALGATILAGRASEATSTWEAIQEGLKALGRHTAAAKLVWGGNFRIVSVQDLIGGVNYVSGKPLTPLPPSHLQDEVGRLRSSPSLTLRFLTPLRFHKPKDTRDGGRVHFDRRMFLPTVFVRRLRHRLERLGVIPPGSDGEVPPKEYRLQLVRNRLAWLDLSYGRAAHRKHLGGAMGTVTLSGITAPDAEVLVYGQYYRLGENTRFGFGAYRIAELGDDPFPCARARPLLETLFDGPALDEAAFALDVDSGRVRQAVHAIQRGVYQPDRHTRLEIQTGAGKQRTLAIPSRRDRALQRAVLARLAPALDQFLEDASVAYRRGLGRHDAAQRTARAYRLGYRWALRADFASFFDRIEHDELEDRVAAYTGDRETTGLLMVWIRAGAPTPGRGVPTGAPLSPLLANVLLDQFDEHIAAQHGFLVRYADDFLILFREESQSRHVYEMALTEAAALRLELNSQKLQWLDLKEPFEFLGFRFEHREQWELSPRGEPVLLEDLGWRQAKPPTPPVDTTIHLPGESAWQGRGATVVIWGPGADQLNVQGNQLLCRSEGRTAARVRVDEVGELIVLGRPTIEAAALEVLRRRGVSLLLADDAARGTVWLSPEMALENAEAAIAQAAAATDPTTRLSIARALVAAKLRNHAALADAWPGRNHDRSTGRFLRKLAVQAEQAADVDQLLGFEGAGAARWYAALPGRLPEHFSFAHRVAPAAADPVNAMLNFGHTLTHRLLVLLIRQAGLLPSLGILHQPRSGHAALASDLQEPFRHLTERAVIEISRRLKPGDFRSTDDPDLPIRIAPAALRIFTAHLHRTFALACHGRGQSEPRPYRQQMAALVRSLRLHLTRAETPLRVFEHVGRGRS